MFVHLHIHSNYSFLTGAIRIEDLIYRAKESGMNALALTDTNGMYGLIDFAKLALEEGIKPILGVQIIEEQNPEIHTVLLAKNREGYSKICKIITERQLNDKFSLVDVLKNHFFNYKDDIVTLTSSIKLLQLLKKDLDINKLRNIYIELFSVKKNNPLSLSIRKKSRELYDFAKENHLPIVATNPVYFLKREDYLIHKVLLAIKFNTTLSHVEYVLKNIVDSQSEYKVKTRKFHDRKTKTTENKFSFKKDISKKIFYSLVNEESYFKTSDEMVSLWRAIPEAIENTIKIANECNVDLEFGKYKHPKFPLPEGETAFSYLWKIAFRGLEERYKPLTRQAVERLQEELSVIEHLGFADYFLIVWDIVQQARKMNMMILGRGSAANSIVAYCLGITQIDPLKHNLFFERFLNLGRASPPDIDLDFSWKERDSIIKYVFEKYGYDKVAMISTTVTFRARSAFREVAKVFGMSDYEISEFSKFIPWTSAENLPYLSEKFPESRHLKFKDEPWRTIVQIAQKISAFPHHLSIHPGGLVISPEPITNYVALEYAENKGIGVIITQPDMYPIEDLGLVKIDLLSQRSLAVVKDTMRKINESSD